MVNQIVDCIIIAIIILGAIIGAKRGFIKSVLKVGSGIISLIIANTFTKKLSTVLNSKYFFATTKDKITDIINSYLSKYDTVSSETLSNAVPDAFKRILSYAGYDIDVLASNAVGTGNESVSNFIDSCSAAISNSISAIVAFIVLFLGVFIVLKVSAFFLDAVFSHLPVIKQINSALGLLFGIICTIVNVWIFSAIALYIIELIRTSSPDFLVGFSREETIIFKALTAINPISMIFKN